MSCNRAETARPSQRTRAETGHAYIGDADESRHDRKEKDMSIISSIGRIASDFSAARARYQTERMLRDLPDDIRKDIGWPDALDPRTGHARLRVAGR